MIPTIVLSGVLAAFVPVDDGAKAPLADLSAYEAARAKTGPGADAQVKLALWCEANGLSAERMKHLARAVLADPRNATARGLMGLVAYHGKWVNPEAVAEKVKADPKLAAATAEYLQKRVKTADTADAQYKLAIWCEENGLSAQAVAHFRQVIKLDPNRETAWKRLGYKRHNGRWVIPGQLEREKAESEAQKHATKFWTPRLERVRDDLESKTKVRRAAGEAAMAGVTDPRAVPVIWSVFVRGNEARQGVAVRLFAQIDAPTATQSLAVIALSGRSAEVRRRATEVLRRRDPRDYAMMLVSLMRKPVKFEYTPVGGPGQTGSLFVEGETVNTQRRYTPPQLPNLDNLMASNGIKEWGVDADGMPVMMRMTIRPTNPRIEPGAIPNQFGSLSPDGQYVIVGAGAGQIATGMSGQAAGQEALIGQILHNPARANQIIADKHNQPSSSPLTSGPDFPQSAFNPQLTSSLFPGSEVSGSQTLEVGRAYMGTQQAALSAESQLENDARSLERYNKNANDLNRQVVDVLNNATGQSLPPDPQACQMWAVDQLGYALGVSQPAPVSTVSVDVPLEYQLDPLAGFSPSSSGYDSFAPTLVVQASHSCFAKGTSVRTQSGLAAIETVRAGDLVLVQNTKTGALGYQAVVTAYHNPPNATYKVVLDGGETVVATGIHRFWKAGKGWTMARDLKVGDALRTVEGTLSVKAIERDDTPRPVFNLEVADGADFFVGDRGLLVHDNSLVNPEPAPFDGAPSLEALGVK